jgi:shikimate kinase
MVPADPSRRVFLIGFMGAGKTSVGRVLAQRLGWRFHDLDDVIEAQEGRSVAAIFAESGEPAFRQAERLALRSLLQEDRSGADLVIALGGGTFVQPENRNLIEQAMGTTVLLEAPLEELRRRCNAESRIRPLAQQEARFAELFAARRQAYERAQFRVATLGKAVEEVAQEIERILSAVKPEVKQ